MSSRLSGIILDIDNGNIFSGYKSFNFVPADIYTLDASLTIGTHNTVYGYKNLNNITPGTGNCSFGYLTLGDNESNYNTAYGYKSGVNNTSNMDNNTFYGANTDIDSSDNLVSNSTAIGYGATIDASNKIVLGNNDVTELKTAANKLVLNSDDIDSKLQLYIDTSCNTLYNSYQNNMYTTKKK